MVTQIRKQPPINPRQAARRCGPIDDLLDPGLFKALCDPTRATLIACLAKCGRPCSVSEVAECCSVDLSVVSRHLALMERSGVLESVKRGRNVHYRVRFHELVEILRNLADAIEACCPDAVQCDGGGCCRGK